MGDGKIEDHNFAGHVPNWESTADQKSVVGILHNQLGHGE
jgi:hypothetical protein